MKSVSNPLGSTIEPDASPVYAYTTSFSNNCHGSACNFLLEEEIPASGMREKISTKEPTVPHPAKSERGMHEVQRRTEDEEEAKGAREVGAETVRAASMASEDDDDARWCKPQPEGGGKGGSLVGGSGDDDDDGGIRGKFGQ